MNAIKLTGQFLFIMNLMDLNSLFDYLKKLLSFIGNNSSELY